MTRTYTRTGEIKGDTRTLKCHSLGAVAAPRRCPATTSWSRATWASGESQSRATGRFWPRAACAGASHGRAWALLGQPVRSGCVAGWWERLPSAIRYLDNAGQ